MMRPAGFGAMPAGIRFGNSAKDGSDGSADSGAWEVVDLSARFRERMAGLPPEIAERLDTPLVFERSEERPNVTGPDAKAIDLEALQERMGEAIAAQGERIAHFLEGLTGTGKTEVVRQQAGQDGRPIITLDLSDIEQQPDGARTLLGNPRGYLDGESPALRDGHIILDSDVPSNPELLTWLQGLWQEGHFTTGDGERVQPTDLSDSNWPPSFLVDLEEPKDTKTDDSGK
jgi:hypothetical protein